MNVFYIFKQKNIKLTVVLKLMGFTERRKGIKQTKITYVFLECMK